jgi:predicted peptidase
MKILQATILTPLLAVCLMSPAFARPPETGFLDRTISVAGETYRYQVFVPFAWDKRQSWPVILFLHGAGERGDDGLLQTDVGLGHAIRENAANFPFVVVMPQCRKEKVWSEPAMQAQALAALDRTTKEFHGDPGRTYLTGISMGGYGTWDLAAKLSRRFAAYVPVCGGIHGPPHFPDLSVGVVSDPKVSDPYAETARRIGRTPVWIFHGDADPTVPVEESRKMYAALQAAQAKVKYTEYPGVGHESWNHAYAEPNLVPWLLEQHGQH